MSDPYGALASQDPAATDDPYAALIPKGKAATAPSPPSDTDPYAALVPTHAKESGGYPTADNKIDPLAHPDMPNVLTALVQGIMSGARGVQSTVQGGGPTYLDKSAASPAAAPLDTGSLTSPVSRGLPQVAYRLGEGAPMFAGGVTGATAGGIAAPEFSPLSELVGGGLGASIGSMLQSLGPAFDDELKQTPNDPEGAWSRAKIQAGIGAAGAGLGWGAFGARFLEGPIKNALFQAVSIQPGIGVGTKVAQNVAAGRPTTEGTSQAAIEAGVMTGLPALGHPLAAAAVKRFGRGSTTPPPTAQQVADVFNGVTGADTGPASPPPGEPPPQGFPPAPPGYNAATAFPKPPEGFDFNTAFPPPATPPDYTVPPAAPTGGYDELNPPPIEPPPMDVPASGPVNIDMGFGYSIQRRKPGEPFTFVDSEGQVISKSDDFADIKTKAGNYLDTGSVGDLQGPVSTPPTGTEPAKPPVAYDPSTDVDPKITQFIASKLPKLTVPEGGGTGPTTPEASIPPLPENPPLVAGARHPLPNGSSIRSFHFDNEKELNWGIFSPEGELQTGFSSWKDAKDTAQRELGRGGFSAEALKSNASLRPNNEEYAAAAGVDSGRMAKLLGAKLYGTPENLPTVSVKELFQNGFDAIKPLIENGTMDGGTIHIRTDSNARTISIYDNGSGMTPDVFVNKFFKIAGTHKEGNRNSGGLGIAKMLTLFESKEIRVLTMRDGRVGRVATTGPELFEALDDPSKNPKITYSAPTPKEMSLFPDGHGTIVSVTVPKSFIHPETGDKQDINFPTNSDSFDVLNHSPLLANVHVTFNGETVPNIGATFPIQDFTPLMSVKFPWGTGRVYVSKTETGPSSYSANAHMLSNGLWQFSEGVKVDVSRPYGPNVPRTFYFDFNPKVKPEDPGYPFDLNRQRFAKSAESAMGKILAHLSLLFEHEDLRNSAVNFGDMYYLGRENGQLTKSDRIKIEPKKASETPVSGIKVGDKIEVVDGELHVKGQKLPDVNLDDLKNSRPDSNDLKIPQKEIDATRIIVHDNTVVHVSDAEQKSISQLASEKFGSGPNGRFDHFALDIGELFRDLRNLVAKKEGFSGLLNEPVGISFDTKYRGVSIRVPFSASFINPAIPEAKDTLRAAVGMYYTMLHELAHHVFRSEDGLTPIVQSLATELDTQHTYEAHAIKQRFVNLIARDREIFDFINDFYSGAYNLQPRGRTLKTDSSYEAGNGHGLGASAQASGTGRGREVSETSGNRTPRSAKSLISSGAGLTAKEPGGYRDLRGHNTGILRAIDSGLEAEAPQPELDDVKKGVNVASGGTGGSGGGRGTSDTGGSGAGIEEFGIHADKMNKMMKWLWGLDRLVDENPRFTPLVRYAERIREMRLDTSKLHDAALRIAKRWRKLGSRAENVSALLDDVTNMNYRTPNEVSKGVRRMPTKPEFDAMVAKHGVDSEGLRVFDLQRKFFSIFLDLVTQNAKDTAIRTIQDPVALAAKLDSIKAAQENLAKAPYFPFTRFGSHFLTVRDAAGNVTFFQTYERKGLVSAERAQQRAKANIERTLPAGSKITEGVLPETAQPFVGMPPELLESIMNELNLTQDQKDALDQIRYQHAPAASFVHHFQQKNYTPGYSDDFLRAFSRYAFHGARFYSRVKYAWALRDEIKAARGVGGNKAGAIANYMEDHLQNAVLDAKGDFGLFKGAIFLWVFGYSPAGAFVNLSQVPLITHSFLAAKYGGAVLGDARSAKALVKAMTQLSSFYKKGAYDNASEFEMRALDYGIKSGRISEAMASELAGLAQGSNLLGLGKSKSAQALQIFMEKAASLFELSEQFNRRVTYRATLDLAMAHPNSLGVKEALNKYPDEFEQLKTKGFNEAEARAIVAAAHATEQTQFVYSRETRPRAFRGSLAGTLLVFKTYMLNVLQLMGANKSSVMPRFLLMMLAMAGIYGLPGSEDINDIVEQLGKWYFGKDFKVKLALRQFILEIGGGKIPPDIVLNGLARKGFGIPALVDLMGEHPGRGLGGAPDTPETRAAYAQQVLQMKMKGAVPGSYEEFRKQHSQNVPVPQLDLSKALGMGRLLPFDLGKVLDPGNDPNTAIAGTAQQASGAIFSVGFNLYKALQDDKTPASDWKRWERTMPRAVASASRAYRAYDEGRERSKGGPAGAATIANYDARDPEQAAEIMAMAAGFMPSRQSSQWDSIVAQSEVEAKFKFEKELLMGQMYEAHIGKNQEEVARVRQSILDYNKNLPQWARGMSITGQQLKSSIENRYKEKQYREAGVPRSKNVQPIAKHVQGLFPESVVDVRRLPQ